MNKLTEFMQSVVELYSMHNKLDMEQQTFNMGEK